MGKFKNINVENISLQKIKAIKRLHSKKFRNEEQLFIAEGVKIVQEIIDLVPDWIEWIVVTPNAPESLLNKINPQHYLLAKPDEMARVSSLSTASLALAVVRIPKAKNIDSTKKTLVLDGIQDPGNLGTIIRTADWFGIHQIVCSENCAELWNPKTIQASMGSFLRVNVHYCSLPTYLKSVSTSILGTLLDGKSPDTIDWAKSQHVIMGSEGKGISDEVKPFISQTVTIPGFGGAESLNVGIATGIVLYEWSKSF